MDTALRRTHCIPETIGPVGHPYLTVVTGVHVTRVVLDYSVGGVTQTAEAAREMILSGGTINSPQLLMLSGIGPAAHLRDHARRCRATSRA